MLVKKPSAGSQLGYRSPPTLVLHFLYGDWRLRKEGALLLGREGQFYGEAMDRFSVLP